MSEDKRIESREIPNRVDIYTIGEDGSIAEGVGVGVENIDAFIDEESSGRLFEKDTALFIRANCGKVVGVMRFSKFDVGPKPFRTRKMILGKANLP